MKAGDKVRCTFVPPAWKKQAKPCPKVGWVYLIKSISSFDENGKPADIGTQFAFELEGIGGKVKKRAFFPPSRFELIPSKPPVAPRKH
jgi:hypothetical protein